MSATAERHEPADVGSDHAAKLALARAIEKPGEWALFLDIDGTLLDLAPTPDSIVVPETLPADIDRLAKKLGGALALVTGRALLYADDLFKPFQFPIAGLHGAELRTDPRETAPQPERLLEGPAMRLAALLEDDPAAWLEDKGAAIAVHFRGAPHRGPQLEQLLREAVEGCPVEIIAGKCVFEARPHGVDKGAAVRSLMLRPPFQGRRPVYVGDDVTDEDGIRAAQALGGLGIKVGAGDSVAQWRLENPAAVRQWLASIESPGGSG